MNANEDSAPSAFWTDIQAMLRYNQRIVRVNGITPVMLLQEYYPHPHRDFVLAFTGFPLRYINLNQPVRTGMVFVQYDHAGNAVMDDILEFGTLPLMIEAEGPLSYSLNGISVSEIISYGQDIKLARPDLSRQEAADLVIRQLTAGHMIIADRIHSALTSELSNARTKQQKHALDHLSGKFFSELAGINRAPDTYRSDREFLHQLLIEYVSANLCSGECC